MPYATIAFWQGQEGQKVIDRIEKEGAVGVGNSLLDWIMEDPEMVWEENIPWGTCDSALMISTLPNGDRVWFTYSCRYNYAGLTVEREEIM